MSVLKCSASNCRNWSPRVTPSSPSPNQKWSHQRMFQRTCPKMPLLLHHPHKKHHRLSNPRRMQNSNQQRKRPWTLIETYCSWVCMCVWILGVCDSIKGKRGTGMLCCGLLGESPLAVAGPQSRVCKQWQLLLIFNIFDS